MDVTTPEQARIAEEARVVLAASRGIDEFIEKISYR